VNLRRHSPNILVVSCVLGVTACAPALRDTQEVQRIVRLDDAGIRNVALLVRMEDSRVLDAALVARLLQDTVPEIRARAVLAAGRVGDAAASELARHALRDGDARVRAHAALAVGLLNDTSQAAIEALDSLARFDAGSAAVEAVAVSAVLAAPGPARPFTLCSPIPLPGPPSGMRRCWLRGACPGTPPPPRWWPRISTVPMRRRAGARRTR
jgi:hypothetical protein